MENRVFVLRWMHHLHIIYYYIICYRTTVHYRILIILRINFSENNIILGRYRNMTVIIFLYVGIYIYSMTLGVCGPCIRIYIYIHHKRNDRIHKSSNYKLHKKNSLQYNSIIYYIFCCIIIIYSPNQRNVYYPTMLLNGSDVGIEVVLMVVLVVRAVKFSPWTINNKLVARWPVATCCSVHNAIDFTFNVYN